MRIMLGTASNISSMITNSCSTNAFVNKYSKTPESWNFLMSIPPSNFSSVRPCPNVITNGGVLIFPVSYRY